MAAAKRERGTGDGEKVDARPAREAPHQPTTPIESTGDASPDHSPLIPWGSDKESDASKPYKNLK